ncbi:MAG: hypothetical protein JSW54_13730 [Fidelibacterota bacterium]|nr:MAG: hypothetical protein JSW54_13730 [Candidatus Neomarinimicrobiota bacterium]
MRTTIVTAIILAAALPIFAQEEVLISGKVSHGGFGGASAKITQVSGQPGFMIGSRAGWIINHKFVLGTSNYNLLSRVDVPEPGIADDLYLAMEYSGLEVEYIPDSDRLIHYSSHALFALGTIYLRDRNFHRYTNDDFIFAFEPSLSVTLNVVKFFRLSLSGSYRLVFGVESGGLENKDLSGPGAALTLKFGKF